MEKLLNEFRQDLVSGDWVLLSAVRAHSIRKFEGSYQPKEGCPFEEPEKSGQQIVWGWPDKENWRVMVVKNKFPAVEEGVCTPNWQNGPFTVNNAIGNHNVIIYRDHDTHLADFTVEEMIDVFRVYRRRYKEMAAASDCVEYVMIFHNFGREAGASIYHPHSQIISMPILPPDVSRSLYGSYRFYQKNKKRVYDVIIQWELKQKKRIVYENDLFIAFCPFVSKSPYEVRIFPRDSHAHFEQMPEEFDKYLAQAMIAVLQKIKKALANPPYNFFIHTSSPREKMFEKFHEFYTWHIEILPKLSIAAGFELGTGVDINVVDPDQAAEMLKNV
ncbi:MAG: DUF4931 domain-containing protein [Candidatus Paceibacteria bacterium]